MKKKWIWVGILLLLLLAAGVLLALVCRNYGEESQYDEEIRNLRQVTPRKTGEDSSDENENALSEIQQINGDVVGWITIPDTAIDFPVVQSGDNDYYLHRDLKRQESVVGVPFLDYRCAADFSDFQSIIYGHHIKGGRMFSGLTEFQNNEYFNSHSSGYLTTENRQYRVQFFACLNVKNDSFIYQTVFLTEEEKVNLLGNIKDQSLQLREFEESDMLDRQLVTLSTCSYEFTDARTVLIGYLEE